jgi:glycosyltransferase involved in cell wall biosynthesis
VKIFLAGTSLFPPYGGPAYLVSRLAVALTQTAVQVGLWAPDQSAATTPFLSGVPLVKRLTGSASDALNCFGRPDVLHDNGIWLAHNHQLAKLAAKHDIPRVVSTRGMLEPCAVNHKRLKKRVAWWLYQRSDLKQADYLHTTGDAEARNLQRLRLGVSVCSIPNGVDLPVLDVGELSTAELKIRRGGKKTALFIGRIYPVKGLPMLIEAWSRVRPEGWVLQIAGPDKAGHQAPVARAVSAAGLNKIVTFLGPLNGEVKESTLLEADLFVLPTYSESFGMVIAEVLAHGLPVLTTTAAPWPTLSQRGCGWRVDPTVDGIAAGLRQATSLDLATLQAMGARGRTLVATQFGWDRVAEQFLSVYEDLIA